MHKERAATAELDDNSTRIPVMAGPTSATGRAAVTVDSQNLKATVHVNTEDLDDADAAHVHVGDVDENGPVVFALAQDGGAVTHWFASAVDITEEQLGDYQDNLWYVNVHTPDNPDGEARGQIVPDPPPLPDTEDPVVSLGSLPPTISGTVTLTATASDDAGVVRVRFRVNGTVVRSDVAEPYSVQWDTTTVADGPVTITATAEDAAGNVGVSDEEDATVNNDPDIDPYTFTEFRTEILATTCAVSGCHTGGSPPAGLNMSGAGAYGNLVNVASTEVPALLRVEPGNADDSYIIRKLEGGPGISGARMPFGGPLLDQPTIDRIRAWIDEGAADN